MRTSWIILSTTFALGCAICLAPVSLVAEDVAKPAAKPISLADGKITLPVPKGWDRKKPRTRIVEHEFAAKGPEGAAPARVTIMGAGGGLEANIARWQGQFSQPDGSSTRDKTKTEKAKVGDTEVHIVDITGTYLDKPGGPFAGGRTIPRPKYRMLGAIIVTKNSGHYFVKVIGEAKTVEANVEPLKAMLKELKVK